jgi:hypothetical protein
MSAGIAVFLWVIWTVVVFWLGVAAHWWATRKQRRLLKRYRLRAQALDYWGRSIE